MYLGLAHGRAGFLQDFPCPVVLGIPLGKFRNFAYGAFTLLGIHFHVFLLFLRLPFVRSHNPLDISRYQGFRLFPFRSPLLRESLLLSFPTVTKMFQFTAFPHYLRSVTAFCCRISPFGYLRISDYLHLPVAFRSSSRPSSAPSAKAFTLCSYFLNFAIQYYPLFKDLSCLLFVPLSSDNFTF